MFNFMIMKRFFLFILILVQTFTSCAKESGSPDPGQLPPASGAFARSGLTDIQNCYDDPDEIIRQRFDLYKSIGVDLIRVEVDWSPVEAQEGIWDYSKGIFNYMKIAKEYGFKIKLILGVMMAPPEWYFVANPEARYRDENGITTPNCMSMWYPGLRDVISEKSEKIVEMLKQLDLWDCIDYVIPAYGAAGEPIYPAAWTVPGQTEQTFWCYDDNAHKSFREYASKKYSSVSEANEIWDTDFQSWDDVHVLKPGTKPGAYWNDVLTWYRDSKREYVKWQTSQVLGLVEGTDKKVIIYIPGKEYTAEDWDDAVRTGRGNGHIMEMADSRFLVDVAAENGCQMQITGLSNVAEVARVAQYCRSKNVTHLWGENEGTPDIAGYPAGFAQTIINNGLLGLDYTHGKFMFEDDGITPKPEVVETLKYVYSAIKKHYGEE